METEECHTRTQGQRVTLWDRHCGKLRGDLLHHRLLPSGDVCPLEDGTDAWMARLICRPCTSLGLTPDSRTPS
jgi:hypothetical protein